MAYWPLGAFAGTTLGIAFWRQRARLAEQEAWNQETRDWTVSERYRLAGEELSGRDHRVNQTYPGGASYAPGAAARKQTRVSGQTEFERARTFVPYTVTRPSPVMYTGAYGQRRGYTSRRYQASGSAFAKVRGPYSKKVLRVPKGKPWYVPNEFSVVNRVIGSGKAKCYDLTCTPFGSGANNAWAGVPESPGVIACFNAPARSTADLESYVGAGHREVFLEFCIGVSGCEALPSPGVNYRFVVVQDFDNNGSFPAPANVFDSHSGLTTTNLYLSSNIGRFKILYDRVWRVPGLPFGAANTFIQPNVTKKFKIALPGLSHRTQGSAAGYASIRRGGVFAFFTIVADAGAPTVLPTATMATRYCFVDMI